MKKIIVDLDGTITVDEPGVPYPEKRPNVALIQKLVQYQNSGYKIVIYTARNMRKYDSDIEKIKLKTLPEIENWLKNHAVPYDEIYIGKQWCDEGFYIDDKSIRPSEFISLSEDQILKLVNNE
jgi:capsule biosynthesis phosphatase